MFCQCVSSASAETNAQMLAFPFLNRRAAVCGNSFVHWVSALHWRVHVCMCCLSSQRGVNCFTGLDCLCLLDMAFMLVAMAERETWRVKKQTKLPHSLIHQLSGSVLCVHIPRRCMLWRCLATFDAGTGVSFAHLRGAVFALCKVDFYLYFTRPHHHLFSAWMIQWMVGSHKAREWREDIFVY